MEADETSKNKKPEGGRDTVEEASDKAPPTEANPRDKPVAAAQDSSKSDIDATLDWDLDDSLSLSESSDEE